MCGIAGIYHFNPDDAVKETDLWRMGDAIAHRGPDNKNVFMHHNSGLAYRRLSIIDTTEQEQPILTNEDRSVCIAFNGEIYNFPALKKELVEKGHRFYTGTDTETVVHLYEEEGPDCVKRLNGIFAFAILDMRDGSVFIARDQMGIKPLYYTHNTGRFLFASEIKSILTRSDVPRQVNPRSLSHYFRYRFVPDPETMFAGIYKLPPGHWIRVEENGIKIQQYWSLKEKFEIRPACAGRNSKFEIGEEGTVVKVIRDTLEKSVKSQLLSDVPLGAFLSGGIDSSIVVGLMAGMMNEPVKTFSVGFGENEYDEMDYARQISQRYGTDHHELVLTPDHVKQLPEIVWHLDEPLADPAAVPVYFLSQLARQDVTVVLTGEGGDELFAGYKEDFPYRLGQALNRMPDAFRQQLAWTVAKLPNFSGKTRLYRSLLPDRDRAEHILTDLFRFENFSITPPSANLGGLLRASGEENNDYDFNYHWDQADGLDWLTKMIYLETQIWLPGDPLMKVDKMTMAQGLEARVPILDMEVVDLAAQIPSSLKNKNGVEKYLLRQAFSDLLPADIFARKKKAFEIPVREWLQKELKPLVDEHLSEQKLSRSGFLDAKQTRRVVRQHMDGKHDYRYEVWALLCFQIWHERVFGI